MPGLKRTHESGSPAPAACSALARYQGSLCECVQLRWQCDQGNNSACQQLDSASCWRYPALYGMEEMCGIPL